METTEVSFEHTALIETMKNLNQQVASSTEISHIKEKNALISPFIIKMQATTTPHSTSNNKKHIMQMTTTNSIIIRAGEMHLSISLDLSTSSSAAK